jgi:hypothetical protein
MLQLFGTVAVISTLAGGIIAIQPHNKPINHQRSAAIEQIKDKEMEEIDDANSRFSQSDLPSGGRDRAIYEAKQKARMSIENLR